MRQCISSTLLPFPPHFSSSTSFLSSPPPFPSSLSLLFLPLLPSSLFLRTSLLLSFTPLIPSSISLLSSPPPFHSSLPLLPFPALFPSSLFLLSFPPPFPSALPFPFFLLSSPPPFPSSLPFLHFPPLFPSCLSVLPFTSIPPFFQVFGGSLHGGDEARQSSSGSLVPRSFQVFGEEWSFGYCEHRSGVVFGEEWSFVWVLRAQVRRVQLPPEIQSNPPRFSSIPPFFQVFGEEWSFGYCERGSGVFSCRPKSNPYYTYRETVDMGETKLSAKRAGQIIAEMSVQWPGVSYDMLGRNCNHFCDELCVKLGVGPIPAWVNRFARTGDSAAELYDQVGQQLFSEAAPETSGKVTRDDVAKAAESLVKQAVKASSPPKEAEATPLLTGFRVLGRLKTRPALFPPLSLPRALVFHNHPSLTTQRAQLLPRQVGVLQSAYAALKKLPVSNEAAVGRALVTVAASMKDVAREVGEMVGREGVENGAVGEEKSEEKGGVEEEGRAVEGGGVQERPGEKDGKVEENLSSNDEEDGDGGDGGDGEEDDEDKEEEEASLGEEERELGRNGLRVCVAAEGVIRFNTRPKICVRNARCCNVVMEDFDIDVSGITVAACCDT
ncbi:unnamed protein product [Closterium sp. NIES-64]|nr:unnamed protein product [Closterium sp. NIES-64]